MQIYKQTFLIRIIHVYIFIEKDIEIKNIEIEEKDIAIKKDIERKISR